MEIGLRNRTPSRGGSASLQSRLLARTGLIISVMLFPASVLPAESHTMHSRQRKANTPPRIHVGVIAKGERLIAPEYNFVSEATGQETLYFPRWIVGHLDSGECGPSLRVVDNGEDPASVINRERRYRGTCLRRWRWKEDRLWCVGEALCGAEGPFFASWSVVPPLRNESSLGAAIEISKPERSQCFDQEFDRITEYHLPPTSAFSDYSGYAAISRLAPLYWGLDYDGDRKHYYHPRDGLDLVPQADGSWTLLMLQDVDRREPLSSIMSVWDCTIQPVRVDGVIGYRTQWQMRTQFRAPWSGPFFAIDTGHDNKIRAKRKIEAIFRKKGVRFSGPDLAGVYEVDGSGGKERVDLGDIARQYNFSKREYVLVRESGQVYGMVPREGEEKWKLYRETDPVDYLVAIVYAEPNLGVYGFGRKFWVRLDTTELLRFWACRDITQGTATYTDVDGREHEIGEPFRTVWQCAQVLKEEGVLQELEHVAR